jgi:hypothetical protein
MFEAQQGRPNLVNSFWPQCAAALEHIGEHGVAADLRPAVDSLLRAYVARHAGYRADTLAAPIAKYRLVDFGAEPMEVLEQFSSARDLSAPDRIAVLRRLLYLNQQQPAQERNDWAADTWRQELASLLLDAGDPEGARAVVASVPDSVRADRWRGRQFLELELRIAAQAGELASVLEPIAAIRQMRPGSTRCATRRSRSPAGTRTPLPTGFWRSPIRARSTTETSRPATFWGWRRSA